MADHRLAIAETSPGRWGRFETSPTSAGGLLLPGPVTELAAVTEPLETVLCWLAEAGIERKLHMVRGHFKVRRTGVFFWNAFQRGNPALGFMHKDYELRLPKQGAAA
jgi:hypothetical protein